MDTTFDPWLKELEAAKKGPVELRIDRGLPFRYVMALQLDLTGAVFTAALRTEPDAGVAPLVSFTVTSGVAAGVTTVTLALTKEQTAALPADGDGDALVALAFDLLVVPAGGTQSRLLGGTAIVSGKVTNAS